MAITREQILNRAISEVGVTEYPPNSNKVKYNTWYYGKEVSGASYPWCMTFIQWIFKDSGLLPIKTASCSALYNEFKKRGQIVTNPEPGDIVFFKWNTSNYPCQHVGLVLSVGGSAIISIEGNTSINSNDNGGSVMRRSRPRNKSIVAYARPKWENVPLTEDKPVTSPKKTVDEVAREVIKGKWGSGADRRKKLTEAGYNYAEVQNRVNQILKGK